MASPPAARISASTRCPSSSRMSPKTTLAPSRTKSLASVAPCPRAPPLISATLPLSLPIAASSMFPKHLDCDYEHTYVCPKYTLDIIGNRRLAHAEETPPPHGHGFGPPPSGGRQEGGSLGGREDWGHPVRAVPLSQPPPARGRRQRPSCPRRSWRFLLTIMSIRKEHTCMAKLA